MASLTRSVTQARSQNSTLVPVLSGPAGSSAAFVRIAGLVTDTNKITFTCVSDLAREVKERIDECLNSNLDCSLLITGVTEDIFPLLDGAFYREGIRRQVRFTYENLLQSLIIRLVPSYAHANTSRSFFYEIAKKIDSFPELVRSWRAVGDTTCDDPGRRSKEGDEGFKQLKTRPNPRDWPSLTIEVGYPQTLQELRLNAEWWLNNSGGLTRMVIVINIDRNPHAIRMECWEMYRNPEQCLTRSTAPKPTCRQWFDINSEGQVTTHKEDAVLTIPFLTIYDTGPQDHPPFTFSTNELSDWASDIFEGLG